MIFCCYCVGTLAGSFLSFFGIFWFLVNAEKILKIIGIIILAWLGLFLLECFISFIVYVIKVRSERKGKLDWEEYKRCANWGRD